MFQQHNMQHGNRCLKQRYQGADRMCVRLRLKRDGTRAETRFRLSAKRTSSFKSTGASVKSTTGSRDVRISSSNAGFTMFRGSVKSTGYPLHSPVSPSLPLPCVTVCHHISTGLFRCPSLILVSAFCCVLRFVLPAGNTGADQSSCFLPSRRVCVGAARVTV